MDNMRMHTLRFRSVLLVAVLAFAPLRSRAQDVPTPQNDVAQQLADQLATNAALKERIEQLQAALQKDVCADPSESEALLKRATMPRVAR
jgi:hypothetical protein